MSDDELRSLLAEARAWMLADSKLNKDYAKRVLEVSQRIDAALAEPVAECARCGTLRELADTAAAEQGLAQRRMMEAQKQRDEARAEVERLRAPVMLRPGERLVPTPMVYTEVWCDGTQGPCAVSDSDRPHGHWRGGRRVELPDLVSDAYRRGAEAMREAAAVRIDAEGINGVTSPYFGNIIRALPVPEER